jgi:hypothetical protein
MRHLVNAIMLFFFSLFTRTNVSPQPKKTQREVLTLLAGDSESLISKRRAKRIEPVLPVFGPRTKQAQQAAQDRAIEILRNRF